MNAVLPRTSFRRPRRRGVFGAGLLFGLLFALTAADAARAQGVRATDGLLERRTEITWPADTRAGILFRVERNGALLAIVAGTAATYADVAGNPGTVYTYCVRVTAGGATTLLGCDAGSRVVFKPSGVAATDATLIDAVRLTWNDRSEVEAAYDVYRRDLARPDSTRLDSLPAGAVTYRDASATLNKRYRYCVVARDARGFASEAVCDEGTRGSVLPPARVAATDGQFTGFVRVTWADANARTATHTVYRDGAVLAALPADSARFDDATAVLGVTYTYCVAAKKAGAESVRACDAGRRGALAPPTEVAATRDTYDDRVAVTWTDAAPTEDAFEVFRAGILLATLPANTTSYDDRAVVPGAGYLYCVRARSNADPKAPSFSANACAGGRRAAVLAPTGVAATDNTFEDRVKLDWANPSATAMLVSVYRGGALIATLPPSQARHEDAGAFASGVVLNYCVSASTVVGGSVAARDGIALVLEQAATAASVERMQRGDETPPTPAEEAEQAQSLRARVEAMAQAQGGDIVESARTCDAGSRLIKAPTAVAASYDTFEDRVEITWTNNSAVQRGFVVLRQAAGAAQATVVDSVSAARRAYSDFKGVPGVAYTYRVAAYDRSGASAPGTGAGAGSRTLKAPTFLAASDSTFENQIVLTWTDESRAETGYQVYRNGALVLTLAANTTTYTHAGVAPGVAFTYRVHAVDARGASAGAEDAGSTAILPAGSLSASTLYADRVVLAWVDASAVNTGYQVFRGALLLPGSSGLGAGATGFIDAGATGAHTYCVVAVAGAKVSARACTEGGLAVAPTLSGGGSAIDVIERFFAKDSIADVGIGAVDVSGDYAVVRSARGPSAYVFYRDPAQGWTQQATLTGDGYPFPPAADSPAGVAIDGNYVAVGQPRGEPAAVYVFERNTGGSNNWGRVAKLSPQVPALRFGMSLELEGTTLLVGSSANQAFVYVRSGSTWTQQAAINNPGGTGPDNFGSAVALHGDVALIGASQAGIRADGARGLTYVYARSGGTWALQTTLRDNSGTSVTGAEFGKSLAFDGDLALIGDYSSPTNSNVFNPGTVSVFTRNGTTWTQGQRLIASDRAQRGNVHFFGTRIALHGDHAVVSAPYDNEKGPAAGAAYYFRRLGGAWREVAKFRPDDGSGGTNLASEQFGTGLALDGDQILIGAPGARTGDGVRRGAFYERTLVAAPSAVEASDGKFPDRIQVRWQDNALHETAFRVYRVEASGATNLVGTAPLDAEVYDDFSAEPGGAYTYHVTAFSSALKDLDPRCVLFDASNRTTLTACLGESDAASDVGWRPVNGVISGRVAALGGAGTEDAKVCLLPSPNRSLLLDGAGGTVETSLDDLSGDALTIEYWFRGASLQSAVRQQSGSNFFIVAGWNGQHILSNDGGLTNTIPVGAAVTDGRWHHVAMTWQRNTANGFRSYLDGALVAQRQSSNAPLPKIDGSVFLGSFNGLEPAKGQFDEVRIWKVARTQAEIQASMNRPLTGKEARLVGYWPLDQGTRAVAADLTGAGHNGAFRNGAYWADDGAPLNVCATTDAEGNYTLAGLGYGESTAFSVRPSLGARSFNPAFKAITLSQQNPVQNEVNFTDNTAFSVSGIVQFAGTTCPVPGVEIQVAERNEPGVVKGTTASDGTFSVSVNPSADAADRRRITPRLGSGGDVHRFVPADASLFVQGNVASLAFADAKTRVLRGTFGGSCGTNVGTATLRVFTENGCFVREIQASGPFVLQLPPQKYLVQVMNVTGIPPALLASVTEFFDNLGAREVDLTAADDTLDFVYRAPLTMQIAGFPAAPLQCAATGLATVDKAGKPLGVTLPNVPIIGEFERVPLTFTVFEDYGGGQTCPVNAGTVTVFDGIGDVKAPVVLEIKNGQARYTTVGASPDTFEGRVVEGVNRSYQKQIVAVAKVDGAAPVTATRWAVVNGFREKTATFVSAVTQEIPMLVLHDPPGGESYSYLEKGVSTCHTFNNFKMTGGGAGVDIDVVLGFKAGVGFGLTVEAGGGLALRTRTLAGRITEDVTGGLETCVTTGERYATLGDPTWVGEDVFLGVALNLIFAEADVIDADGPSCKVEVSTALAANLDQADPYETTFLYGESHIRHSLIPALEGLIKLAGTDAAVEGSIKGIPQRILLQDALANWKNHLATNDANIARALRTPEQNRSFSSGTEYEYAHSTETTRFSRASVRGYFHSESGIGAVITGGGYDQTFLAAFEIMHEGGTDTGDDTTTTKTVGYMLSDGDTGDFYSVDVGSDPVYGTPVFGIKSGRSSNPWEPGTQKRDLPVIEVATPFVTGVKASEAAQVRLTLTNASESGERRAYILDDPRHLNPNSAVIGLRGDPINEEKFLIDGGKSISVTLAVERGPDLYRYDSLAVIMYPEREMELWKADTRQPFPLSDTAYFSVHFEAPCSDISVLRPLENWRLNAATRADSLQIILHKFDLGAGVTSLGLEYRLRGASTWLPAASVLASALGGADSWAARWLPPQEGAYDVRAYTACPVGRVHSDPIPGVVDTKAPVVFGTPEPADALLSLGDDVRLTFNEPVVCTSVRTEGVGRNAAFFNETAGGAVVPIDVACDGSSLVLAPKLGWGALEGHRLRAELGGVTDAAGNAMGATARWAFTVTRQAFTWRTVVLAAQTTYGADDVLDVELLNGSPNPVTFTLRHVIDAAKAPALDLFRLAANGTRTDTVFTAVPVVTGGTLPPGGSQRIAFKLPPLMPPGRYAGAIVATSAATGDRRLDVTLAVDRRCAVPAWAADPSLYEHSMSITARVVVGGAVSADVGDHVAAFIGGAVRGVARVAEAGAGTFLAHLLVGGNTADIGQRVTFQVYDASGCVVYRQASRSFLFHAEAVHGTASVPVRIEVPPTPSSEVTLNAGWTWISLNRALPDSSLNAVLAGLGTTGDDVIRARDRFATFDPRAGWLGSLTALRPGEGYRARLGASALLAYGGVVVNPATRPILFERGWTWVGYLPQRPLAVNAALGGLAAEENDLIKGQYGFAQFVRGAGWVGSLATLEPGRGYALRAASAGSFAYPANDAGQALAQGEVPEAAGSASGGDAGESAAVQAEGAGRPKWAVNGGAFEHSLVLVGAIKRAGQPVAHPASMLAAFVGDEVRGVAGVQHIAALNLDRVFLTVYGPVAQGETLTFRFYDGAADAVFDASPALPFTANAVHGSVAVPVAFSDAATVAAEDEAVPTAFALHQNYPNPFGATTTLRYDLPEPAAVRLVLYDLLGRVVEVLVDGDVAAGRHRVVLDAHHLASGVYVYRLKAGAFTQTERMLIVK